MTFNWVEATQPFMDDPNSGFDPLLAEQLGEDLDEFPCTPDSNLIVHLSMDLEEHKKEDSSSSPIMRKERRQATPFSLQLLISWIKMIPLIQPLTILRIHD